MSKTEPYVFKDTGEEVQIRKVSPLLIIKLRERYPSPKPPIQTVDYGDGPKTEQNPAHPDYILAQQEYDIQMERRARELLIKRGVVVDWTDERRAKLAEIREFWQSTYDEALPDTDDTVAYVSYVCVGSDSDLTELVEALIKRSQPTEEAITEAQGRLKS